MNNLNAFSLNYLQNQAKSTREKLEKLRHHSVNKRQGVEFLESEALTNDAEVDRLKQQLRELGHKIQHTQSKEQLQAKVDFIFRDDLPCK